MIQHILGHSPRAAVVRGVTSMIPAVEQMIFSGTTFVVHIIAARMLPSEEYGLFTIVYAVVLLIGAIQQAVVLQPFIILASSKVAQSSVTIWWSCLVLSIGVCIGAALIGAVAASFIGIGIATIGAACGATLAISVMNLYRRHWHLHHNVRIALIGGSACLIITTLAIGWLGRVHRNAHAALIAIMLGALASTVVWGAVGWLREPDGLKRIKVNRIAIRQALGHGRWLLGAQVATWVVNNGIYITSALLLSTREVALIRTVANFVVPYVHVVVGLSNYDMVSVARATQRGESLRVIAGGLLKTRLAVGAGYGVGLLLFGKAAYEMLYGRNAAEIDALLWIAAGLPVAVGIANTGMTILRGMGESRKLFQVSVWTTSLGAVGLFASTWLFGMTGAMLGWLIVTVVMATGVGVTVFERRGGFKRC